MNNNNTEKEPAVINDPVINSEVTPAENPSMELAQVLNEGDPDTQLALLERKADLAPRFRKAINTILVTQTFAEDWKEFDGTMCLSSAGAERVARLFDIQFYDVESKREEFTDAEGKSYRYVFDGKAAMSGRVVYAQGVYSTREKFLGWANKKWRPVEDLNENHIRNAAYHIFIGNAIKALLGLRGIPIGRFQDIMGATGEDSSKAGKVQYAKGTKGGTSNDDRQLQKELGEICIEIANAGQTVTQTPDGWELGELLVNDGRETLEVAKGICTALSSFTNKKGETVSGLLASQLKGKRLEITLEKAKKLMTRSNQND